LYQTKPLYEISFLIPESSNILKLVQVCWSNIVGKIHLACFYNPHESLFETERPHC